VVLRAGMGSRRNAIKIKQLATRQRIRKGVLLFSFLLFPVTL
jgi:hypothetical protein